MSVISEQGHLISIGLQIRIYYLNQSFQSYRISRFGQTYTIVEDINGCEAEADVQVFVVVEFESELSFSDTSICRGNGPLNPVITGGDQVLWQKNYLVIPNSMHWIFKVLTLIRRKYTRNL
ncbi:MAG: hypothetical protein R2769_03910 [Saprospiraceae bacterium]